MTQHQQTGICTPGISSCKININVSLRFACRKAHLCVQALLPLLAKWSQSLDLSNKKWVRTLSTAKHKDPSSRKEGAGEKLSPEQDAQEYSHLLSHSTADGHTLNSQTVTTLDLLLNSSPLPQIGILMRTFMLLAQHNMMWGKQRSSYPLKSQ